MNANIGGYPYRICLKHVKAGRRKLVKAVLRMWFKGRSIPIYYSYLDDM